MHRRVYWLLPDPASARATMGELLQAGVELRRMHFVGREDCDLTGLHAANVLQTSDVIRSAETGLVFGAAVGGLLGAAAATYFPDAGGAPQWTLFPAFVAAGAVFEAWTSSMIGISAPNRQLRPFAAPLEQGCVLLMLDVPVRRIEEMRARLQALHPQGRLG